MGWDERVTNKRHGWNMAWDMHIWTRGATSSTSRRCSGLDHPFIQRADACSFKMASVACGINPLRAGPCGALSAGEVENEHHAAVLVLEEMAVHHPRW